MSINHVYLRLVVDKIAARSNVALRHMLDTVGHPYRFFKNIPNTGSGIVIQIPDQQRADEVASMEFLKDIIRLGVLEPEAVMFLDLKFSQPDKHTACKSDVAPLGAAIYVDPNDRPTQFCRFVNIRCQPPQGRVIPLADQLNGVFGKYRVSDTEWDVPETDGSISWVVGSLGTYASVWAVINTADLLADNVGVSKDVHGITICKHWKPIKPCGREDYLVRVELQPQHYKNVELIQQIDAKFLDYRTQFSWDIPSSTLKGMSDSGHTQVVYTILSAEVNSENEHYKISIWKPVYPIAEEPVLDEVKHVVKGVGPLITYEAKVRFRSDMAAIDFGSGIPVNSVKLNSIRLYGKVELDKFIDQISMWTLSSPWEGVRATGTFQLMSREFDELKTRISSTIVSEVLSWTPPETLEGFQKAVLHNRLGQPSMVISSSGEHPYLLRVSITVKEVDY